MSNDSAVRSIGRFGRFGWAIALPAAKVRDLSFDFSPASTPATWPDAGAARAGPICVDGRGEVVAGVSAALLAARACGMPVDRLSAEVDISLEQSRSGMRPLWLPVIKLT
ncbi:ParB N-terminal domain-containing protein [Burkholderia cepacia]|uniref:hypothetical protein n=1 Tax=Burkholderia cepacia TaxID=292 RepID=UPI002ABD21AB|nr:hypothetical protein [Burkholderia cepacia]